jgi:transcriptional regulator with XRE-family HTH domain
MCRMIEPAQSRAARGLLNWNQKDLAKAAYIGVATLKRFENGVHTPIHNNMAAICKAFEDAGIEFIERSKTKGPGVRLRD